MGRSSGWIVSAMAAVVAVLVHRRFPWIPVAYEAAVIALPVIAWRIARWHRAPRAVRWAVPVAAVVVFVALLPVPWMVADLDDPPGNAWQLDGRVTINGDRLDPPGDWYWLTVGRPPTVAEVVTGWFDDEPGPVSMASGRRTARPAYSEPAAAAVGLRRAGWPLATQVMVEVSEPIDSVLPARAVLAQVNDVRVTTRDVWTAILAQLHDVNTFTADNGEKYQFQGSVLPYARVDVIELPDDLDVTVGGRLAGTLPGSWWRNLSLGSSHGLMVALVAYSYGADHDLARGRTIAGTGKILADGAVGAIGGLRSKAEAARRVGADVLLFPAQQAAHLAGFDAGSMELVPVTSLDEAIAALDARQARATTSSQP
jgi:PDZ domain-containing secreted protein